MFYKKLKRVASCPIKDKEIYEVQPQIMGNQVIYTHFLNQDVVFPDRDVFTLENQLKSGAPLPQLNPTQLGPSYDSASELASAIIDREVEALTKEDTNSEIEIEK